MHDQLSSSNTSMNYGFYIILTSQFLSALADNALLFVAIALLGQIDAPNWHTPLLQQCFVISYIIFAPFVGAIADAFAKGKVMFVSNAIKALGCVCMIAGMPPLYAYGIVGIGAATYSPAKYGILTEYLPSHLLVKANGWMEGSTVAAIILGAIIGGKMANIDTYLAMWLIVGLYLVAAIFNHFIPRLPVQKNLRKHSVPFMLQDFYHAFITLWKDSLGQVSLAVTTLFWGVGATLRLAVIAWAGVVLNFNIEQSTQLIAILAIGVAFGSIIASKYIRLETSTKVLPAGIAMGVLVIAMIFVHTPFYAGVLLFLIGSLSGFFLVPLNALLQHRGHHLIGAGHSIAVQNFNEHISILLMLGMYLLMTKANLMMDWIVIAFGLFIIISMGIINHRYGNNKSISL